MLLEPSPSPSLRVMSMVKFSPIALDFVMILIYLYLFWDTLYKSVPNATFEMLHCNYNGEIITSNLPLFPSSLLYIKLLSTRLVVIIYQAGNDQHRICQDIT